MEKSKEKLAAPATVDGELIWIGGNGHSAHAQIIDPEGKIWWVEMDREAAQKIASYLYKGPILRINGDAQWDRKDDGFWHLISFKLTDFNVLSEDTLEFAANRLRKLKPTDWVNIDDIDGFITSSRN